MNSELRNQIDGMCEELTDELLDVYQMFDWKMSMTSFVEIFLNVARFRCLEIAEEIDKRNEEENVVSSM